MAARSSPAVTAPATASTLSIVLGSPCLPMPSMRNQPDAWSSHAKPVTSCKVSGHQLRPALWGSWAATIRSISSMVASP